MNHAPTYALAEIKEKVRKGEVRITARARRGARRIGWDAADVLECVKALDEGDFRKTMPSADKAGLWQDVYRSTFRGEALYLKLQITYVRDAVVISFKRGGQR